MPKEPGHQYIIKSSRATKDMEKIEEALPELIRIASELGFIMNDHVLNFGPSSEIGTLVANAGHAAPHWLDGQKISDFQKGPISVLEYVTSGCPACHSEYQDTTELIKQLSVIMHVIGHIDVFQSSRFFKSREPADSTRASYKLSQFMSEAKGKYGSEEVDKFYQILTSFESAQDLNLGSYESVESLRSKLKKKQKDGDKFRPTASFLQAMIASLPPSTPEWKVEMAKLFEERHSWIGAAYQTKIINEGWAVFGGQHILAKHVPHQSFKELFSFDQLLVGVVGTGKSHPLQFTNGPARAQLPYYLGMHAWKNLYEKFRKRPDIRKLDSEFEIDQKFVEYAHDEILDKMDDQEFLLHALDEQWVGKWNLVLARPTVESDPEFEKAKETITDGKPHIILSAANGWERTVRQFARRVARMHATRPRMLFVDNHDSNGHMRIRHDIQVNEGMPLSLPESAANLYMLANEFNKPVVLEMKANWKSIVKIVPASKEEKEAEKETAEFLEDYQPEFEVVVLPNGKVETKTKDGKPFYPRLDAVLEKRIQMFARDIAASYGKSEDLFSSELQSQLSVSSVTGGGSAGQVNHNPTSAEAVLEFKRFQKKRAQAALEMALNGRLKTVFGANGVKLPAIPPVPEFKLDTSYKASANYGPAPVQGRGEVEGIAHDDSTVIMSQKGSPGDVFGKKEEEKQDGEGGESMEPQEGEPQDGDPQPGDPSDDPQDTMEAQESDDGDESDDAGTSEQSPGVSQIEVDWESWIEALNEKFELRNLRPTGGGEKDTSEIRGGYITGDLEPYHNDENAERAYILGVQYLITQGKSEVEVLSMDRRDVIAVGFPLIPREELVSYGWDKVQDPEFNAVIVLAIDMSGSMNGDPVGRAKKLFANASRYIKKYFPNAIIRFVVFDSEATEIEDEAAVWKAKLGGSTKYVAGVEMAKDILDEYSPAQYNRYFFLAGDAGDETAGIEKTKELLEGIVDDLDFSAYVQLKDYTYDNDTTVEHRFMEAMRDIANKHDKKFTVTQWSDKVGSLFEAIRDLFGKREKK